MTEIFLTSFDFVRSATNISGNVNDKVLASAIREAQEMELQEIIGQTMLDYLKVRIDAGDIDSYTYHKALLDQCQYYLAYAAMSAICVTNAYRVDNAGLTQANDEHIVNAPLSDAFKMSNYWRNKADVYKRRLQSYIYENINFLPQITESGYRKIAAHLDVANNSPIYLGGHRGKIVNGNCR